jgi:predicted flap endonuclease-1-like 5' DNA nuclease
VRPQPSTGGAAAVVAEIIQAPVPLPAAPPAAAPPAAASAAVVSPPDVAARAAFSLETPRAAAVPMRPQAPPAHDNLQRIGHIDAAIAQALGSHGVTRYAHIAQWSPAEVDRFNKLLDANGRISRENWIEQAQILSRGGDTAFSRGYDRQHGIAPASQPAPPAIPAARSVPAAPAVTEARREPAAGVLPRPGATDDLKRIRGIGVLIEKKLNSMGITGYETIANWSAADIDRVSQTLDFKGRIERENWVEQARILASGGATEFSRRVDRGEVETSRPRP